GTQTHIAYQQTSSNSCAPIGSTNATSASFTVTATYSSVCHLASTNLNFGSAGVLVSAVAGTSTVTATCSATTPYTLGLNGGNANASDPTQRKMSNGSVQVVITAAGWQPHSVRGFFAGGVILSCDFIPFAGADEIEVQIACGAWSAKQIPLGKINARHAQ